MKDEGHESGIECDAFLAFDSSFLLIPHPSSFFASLRLCVSLVYPPIQRLILSRLTRAVRSRFSSLPPPRKGEHIS